MRVVKAEVSANAIWEPFTWQLWAAIVGVCVLSGHLLWRARSRELARQDAPEVPGVRGAQPAPHGGPDAEGRGV